MQAHRATSKPQSLALPDSDAGVANVAGTQPRTPHGLVEAAQSELGNGVMQSAVGMVLRSANDEQECGLASILSRLKTAGGGKALGSGDLLRFGAAFGHDFSHVRVHTDGIASEAAEQLRAHAFALGADIYFGPGEYLPGESATDRLLAHELTHVVQHDEGRIGGSTGVSSPSDPLEREATANEGRVLSALLTVDADISAPRTQLDSLARSLGSDLFIDTGPDERQPDTSQEQEAMRDAPPAAAKAGGAAAAKPAAPAESHPGDLVLAAEGGRETPAMVVDPNAATGTPEPTPASAQAAPTTPHVPGTPTAGGTAASAPATPHAPGASSAPKDGGSPADKDDPDGTTVVRTIGKETRLLTVKTSSIRPFDGRPLPLSTELTPGARVWARRESGAWAEGILVDGGPEGGHVQLRGVVAPIQVEADALSVTPKTQEPKFDEGQVVTATTSNGQVVEGEIKRRTEEPAASAQATPAEPGTEHQLPEPNLQDTTDDGHLYDVTPVGGGPPLSEIGASQIQEADDEGTPSGPRRHRTTDRPVGSPERRV